MATKQRLTKRQIREDKFVTNLLKAQQFVIENIGKFIAGLAAVVIVVAVVFLMLRSGQAKQAEAADLLGKAAVEYRGGELQLAAVDLQTILDDYGATDAARLASFYIANIYFDLKNYDQASEYFRLHLDEYRYDKMLTASCMAGLAHCHRAKGEMAEAADMFLEVYEKYPNIYLATDCLYLAADSYAAAEDSTDAVKTWDIINKVNSTAPRTQRLKQMLVEKGILNPTAESYD